MHVCGLPPTVCGLWEEAHAAHTERPNPTQLAGRFEPLYARAVRL